MTARGANIGSPSRNLLQENQRNARNSPSPMRQLKRHSCEMIDKENEDLSNPKKRAKAAPAPRVASRTKQADQVLSPRSANSRNAVRPRSPIRPPTSMARPASPVKLLPPGGGASYLTSMAEKAKSSRAATGASKTGTSAVGRPKKPVAAAAPAPRTRRARPSNSSEASDASARTTIVNRAPAAKKEPAKRTVMGALKSMGAKKTAAAPATSRPAPAGRVLRNRGAA